VSSAPKLRDERLCWLAVRDELARSAARSPANALIGVLGMIRLRVAKAGEETAGERVRSRSMMRYAVAVDELSRRLTDAERAVLRATGEVPDWFLGEVRHRSRQVRL
jgi:hypothetical protein